MNLHPKCQDTGADFQAFRETRDSGLPGPWTDVELLDSARPSIFMQGMEGAVVHRLQFWMTMKKFSIVLGMLIYILPASSHAGSFGSDLSSAWNQFLEDAEKAKKKITEIVEGTSPEPSPSPSDESSPSEPKPSPSPTRKPDERELLLESIGHVTAPSDAQVTESFCGPTGTLGDDTRLEVCLDPRHVGFTLINTGSPKTNPRGGGILRSYNFLSVDRARQETSVYIHEQSLPSGKDSAISMETVLVFIPRHIVPSYRKNPASGTDHVLLPTGEEVVFDSATKEIIGGVLAETGPIDSTPERQRRNFAALQYNGSGIMIRSDQRANTPRSAVVWGQKKKATITYAGQTCTVSPGDLWMQERENVNQLFRFRTDAEFYAFINAKCGWSVSEKTFSQQ